MNLDERKNDTKMHIGERPKSKFWNEMFLRKTEDVVKNDVSGM